MLSSLFPLASISFSQKKNPRYPFSLPYINTTLLSPPPRFRQHHTHPYGPALLSLPKTGASLLKRNSLSSLSIPLHPPSRIHNFRLRLRLHLHLHLETEEEGGGGGGGDWLGTMVPHLPILEKKMSALKKTKKKIIPILPPPPPKKYNRPVPLKKYFRSFISHAHSLEYPFLFLPLNPFLHASRLHTQWDSAISGSKLLAIVGGKILIIFL
jgi:hypothetical protein